MAKSLLYRFEHNTQFDETEAWFLFRIAAFAEAFGWTMLISGILISRYTGSNFAAMFAGQSHGMLFLCYATAAFGLYPSLGWSRRRAFVALLASVPPYGSLLFEQWAGHARRHAELAAYSRFVLWTMLVQYALE